MNGRMIAAAKAHSILQIYPQCMQFFCKRISAFCGLASCFNSRLNRLGAFVCSGFDQPRLVRSIGLRPFESGNEFGMGDGLIHGDLGV